MNKCIFAMKFSCSMWFDCFDVVRVIP